MKRWLMGSAVAAFILLLSLNVGATDVIKLGYVNMQRALENSAAGQEATRKLNEIWDEYKVRIKSEKDRLEAMKEEIDKQSLLWNEETRREKENQLRQLEKDYSRLLNDTQDEIKRKEAELSESIGKDILKIIEEIGRSEGYTIILEKKSSAILYAPSSIDLTDQVIKAYDAQIQ
jgi:outer membrane protein